MHVVAESVRMTYGVGTAVSYVPFAGIQVASDALPVLKGNMVSNCGAYGVEFTNGAGKWESHGHMIIVVIKY